MSKSSYFLGPVGCGTPGFGGADKTKANSPRYITFNAPPGSSAEVSNGEFNIGFNPFTHRIMVMNAGPVWRLTPPEILTSPKPECCEALWEDKSPSNSDILALDPILWTDQKTGRTFVSNNTTGATFEYAYSDNDGDPGGLTPLGWTELALAVPNGGADHETIGSGPYPAALSALTTPINHGQPVLLLFAGHRWSCRVLSQRHTGRELERICPCLHGPGLRLLRRSPRPRSCRARWHRVAAGESVQRVARRRVQH